MRICVRTEVCLALLFTGPLYNSSVGVVRGKGGHILKLERAHVILTTISVFMVSGFLLVGISEKLELVYYICYVSYRELECAVLCPTIYYCSIFVNLVLF